MRAAIYHTYGPADVVQIKDIAAPVPDDNQVLIKIHAASVNPLDWHCMRGEPVFMRIMIGLRKPKLTQLGVDVAGHVEAVGRNITQFKPGDQVFGSCRGAFAEYACTTETALVLKPENLTFEQAASVPVAAFTALQALRDKGRTQRGQKVLINGASGGVGTFAVQIAKSFGADVTGVCSTRNVEMVRSIGADHVIDYAQVNFTKSEQRYDVILDSIGNHSLSACRRILNPNGVYIVNGGPNGRWIGPMARAIRAAVISKFVSQKLVMFQTKRSQADLTTICDLINAGKIIPVIDRNYSLNDVSQAIRYLEEGHARGKVVITIP